MNDAQSKALALIRRPDAALLALDAAARRALHAQLSSTLAVQLPPPGSPPAGADAVLPVLALAGPSQVPADRAGGVPLLVAAQYSGRRDWEVNWSSNLVLVAVNLTTGQVITGHGKHIDRTKPAPPSQSDPAPAAAEAAARIVALEQRDLTALTGDLQRPARYALTALYHDWQSNTVLVDVAGAAGFKAEAPRPLDFSRTRVAGVEAIKPQTAIGVMVSAPGEAAAGAVPVRVAAKIPIAAAGLQLLQSGPGQPVMPVTALLLQRDRTEALQIELAVPATVSGTDAASRVALALFEFNLRAAADEPLPPGQYLLSVAVGGMLSSPRPIRLR
jgi:hypothetical protein